MFVNSRLAKKLGIWKHTKPATLGIFNAPVANQLLAENAKIVITSGFFRVVPLLPRMESSTSTLFRFLRTELNNPVCASFEKKGKVRDWDRLEMQQLIIQERTRAQGVTCRLLVACSLGEA